MDRPTDGMERAMAICHRRWPLNLVTVLRLDAVPEPHRLAAVVHALSRRHPALRAIVSAKRVMFSDMGHPTTTWTTQNGEDHWRTVVESELHRPLSQQSAHLTVLSGEDSADLIFTHHHAVIDGVSAAHLLGELLIGYATWVDDDTTDEPSLPDPPPITSLFPRRPSILSKARFMVRSMRAELAYRWSVRRRAPRVDAIAHTMIHSILLSEEDTRDLRRACRAMGQTLHALLHAAALHTVHRHRYGPKPAILKTVAFSDMRPHLDPPQSPEILAPYVSLTTHTVAVSESQDIWELTSIAQEALRQSISDRYVAVEVSPILMGWSVAMTGPRAGTTAISHTGPVTIAGSDGPLHVRELHAFVSNLPIGPELSMRTGMYDGRLTLDIMGLDTDMVRAEFTNLCEQFASVLRSAATAALRRSP